MLTEKDCHELVQERHADYLAEALPQRTTTQCAAPKPFVHQPHAPWVPEEAQHKEQRSFSRGHENRGVHLADHDASVRVFRWADSDHARLIIETRSKCSTTETMARCTAAELREIAARLLDAAHDLDTYPASVLMRGAA